MASKTEATKIMWTKICRTSVPISNRGTQRCNGRRSHLSKLLSLVQKQLQKYNIGDIIHKPLSHFHGYFCFRSETKENSACLPERLQAVMATSLTDPIGESTNRVMEWMETATNLG